MSEQQTDKVDYAKLFEKERFEWREKIQIISLNLKNIKTVAEAQVELFSTRQILLEYSFKLAQIVSKLSSRERQTRAAKLKDYNQNSDVRYGSNETKVLIEGDVAEIVGKIEMVEGHRQPLELIQIFAHFALIINFLILYFLLLILKQFHLRLLYLYYMFFYVLNILIEIYKIFHIRISIERHFLLKYYHFLSFVPFYVLCFLNVYCNAIYDMYDNHKLHNYIFYLLFGTFFYHFLSYTIIKILFLSFKQKMI